MRPNNTDWDILCGSGWQYVQFLADFTVVRFRSPGGGGGGGKTAKFHVVSFSVLPDRLPVRPRSSMHRLLAGRPAGQPATGACCYADGRGVCLAGR